MAISRELKERWLEALDGGVYVAEDGTEWRPGRGLFCDQDAGTMCCLGVLADLTGSWDEGKYRRWVGGNIALPLGDFWNGLSAKTKGNLARENDTTGQWPVEMIRALPVSDEEADQ